MYEIYLKTLCIKCESSKWSWKKNTFGHSQKRESEEDSNACMNIDGWIHTLCYEIYLKNIMHKMWKLEMKLKKNTFGHSQKKESEEDFNACI